MTPKQITLGDTDKIESLINEDLLRQFIEVSNKIVDDNSADIKSYVEPRQIITFLWFKMEMEEADRRRQDPNRPR